MHLVGGFLDDRNLSKKLTKEIIGQSPNVFT